jgi:hypothetical protein
MKEEVNLSPEVVNGGDISGKERFVLVKMKNRLRRSST